MTTKTITRAPGYYVVRRVRAPVWPYVSLDVVAGPTANHPGPVAEPEGADQVVRYWDGSEWQRE